VGQRSEEKDPLEERGRFFDDGKVGPLGKRKGNQLFGKRNKPSPSSSLGFMPKGGGGGVKQKEGGRSACWETGSYVREREEKKGGLLISRGETDKDLSLGKEKKKKSFPIFQRKGEGEKGGSLSFFGGKGGLILNRLSVNARIGK